MPTASLPMYDIPEVRDANDKFWSALADNIIQNGLKNVPECLSHDRPVREFWDDGDLFISQCCGYDVVERYKGLLRPVATPRYAAFGCLGENYCSIVVVSEDCPYSDVRDMAGVVAAINGPESHSGMNSLRHLVAQRQSKGRFFSEVKISGSHKASLELVRNRSADVAAIDSVTLTMLNKYYDGTLDGLKILGTTYSAPAPPYVVNATMPEKDVHKIRDAILQTFADPALVECRKALLLDGVTLAQQEDYWVHEAFKEHALKHGLTLIN